MLFLQGSEVIFKVALSLLGSHKPLILQHDNLESIVEFIKTTLPNLGLVQMEKTINQVTSLSVLGCTIPAFQKDVQFAYALSLALSVKAVAHLGVVSICAFVVTAIYVCLSLHNQHILVLGCVLCSSSYVVFISTSFIMNSAQIIDGVSKVWVLLSVCLCMYVCFMSETMCFMKEICHKFSPIS